MNLLRELRMQQLASLREQAEKIGIAVGTLLAAEQGKPLRADTIQLICQYYGKTAAELGLVCQRRGKIKTAPEEDDMQRREALTLLVGGSGLTLLAGSGLSLTGEEALTIARTLVGALWRSSESENVTTVARIASWLIAALEKEPGGIKLQKETARIVAEVHLISAIAARHLMKPGERLQHLQQAGHYALQAGDITLQKALPYYEGYSYLWGLALGAGEYEPQPEAALSWFQRGLAVQGGPASPALEASLLTGLAEAYSLLQEPRQAAKALARAEQRYAVTSPRHDPGYALADRPSYAVPLCRARILLNLGQTKEALTALEESQRLYEAQWPQTRGRGLADLQPKRAAVALALGDQELFVEALGTSVEGIQRSKSRYGRAEVKQLLRQGQARWPQAKQLSEWEALIEPSA